MYSLDIERKLSLSKKYRLVEINHEIILVPQSEAYSEFVYSFKDEVSLMILDGIQNHMDVQTIVKSIFEKYNASMETIKSDVNEIIEFLLEKEVITYDD